MPLVTNETQADDFLQSVAKDLDKHRNHLRIQLEKHKIYAAFDGEDILQNTILKVHASIRKNGLQGGEHYNAYFVTSLNRDILKYKAKRDDNRYDVTSLDFLQEEEDAHLYQDGDKRLLPVEIYSWDDEDDDFSQDAKRRHFDAVKASFDELPEKYRELLLMDASGLKYKEICRALNLTMGQVKMRLKSARDIIKAKHNIYPDYED